MNKRLLIKLALFFLCLIFTSFMSKAQEKIRIACVGNSITEGNALSDKLHDAYPVALGRYLGPNFEVINCGVSGRTMLKKGDFPIWNEAAFHNAVAFNPDIVTIMLGTNDSKPYNWIYKDEFMQNYYAMIDTFRYGNADPQIFICLPLPSFSDAFDIRDSVINADIIPMIKQIADSANVNPIDFNTLFLDKSALMPDGIHPLVEGCDLIARTFYTSISGKTIESKTETNSALNQPAYLGNNIVSEITDGDLKTGIIYDISNVPIILELAANTETDFIQINFTGDTLAQLQISAASSSDSLNWDSLADTTLADTTLISENLIGKLALRFAPVNAKYIRILLNTAGLPDSLLPVINEVKVYESSELHAPLWGWKLQSQTSSTTRVQIKPNKITNEGEYIRLYRQAKAGDPFILLANYGSANSLGLTVPIQNSAVSRFYATAYLNNIEIVSDTMTIAGKNATGVESYDENISPDDYVLQQNYPNPFNPETIIEFSLKSAGRAAVEIYDITGKLARVIGEKYYAAGRHQLKWNGKNKKGESLASGVYFYRLKLRGIMSPVKKMILLQ